MGVRCSLCRKKIPKEIVEQFENKIKPQLSDFELDWVLCSDCVQVVLWAIKVDRKVKEFGERYGESI